MRVLFKKDMPGVGRKGEIKNVADGYYRNFLMPHGAAVPATDVHVRQRAAEEERMRADKEHWQKRTEDIVKKLKGVSVIIRENADASGRLFGSVNAVAIERALKKKGIDLEKLRGAVELPHPLKEKGTHRIPLSFEGGVKAECTVIIEGQ